MRIGFIGLGRMGANMVRRLLLDGHEVVAYNRTPEKTTEIAGEGAIASFSIAELVGALAKPRAVWVMVPAGDATEAQIAELTDREPELAAELSKFRDEELEHHDHAIEQGSREAPGYRLLSAVIKAGCRAAIRVSERV